MLREHAYALRAVVLGFSIMLRVRVGMRIELKRYRVALKYRAFGHRGKFSFFRFHVRPRTRLKGCVSIRPACTQLGTLALRFVSAMRATPAMKVLNARVAIKRAQVDVTSLAAVFEALNF